jgi:hypothetical protein
LAKNTTPGRGFALGGRSTCHRLTEGEKHRELATDLGEVTTARAGACRRSRDLGRILSGAARPCWLTSFHASVSVCAWTPRSAKWELAKVLP